MHKIQVWMMKRGLSMTKLLAEGLKSGDLEDLVLPLISFDEFESKIDDDAVVVGFYVSEQDAANDLNRFIQKSAIDIIDTDISPAPDGQGFFMVFVELLNTAKTASALFDLVNDVSRLAGSIEWNMSVRDKSDLVPFTADNISAILDAIRKDEDRTIAEFFSDSDLSDFVVENRVLTLNGSSSGTHCITYEVLETVQEVEHFSPADNLVGAINLQEKAVARANKLNRLLGANYLVYETIDGRIFVNHNNTGRFVVLGNS